MEKEKLFWSVFLILANIALGIAWLLLSGPEHKALEIVIGICWLGMGLGRTYLLMRDLKNIPENLLSDDEWENLP